MKTITLQIGNSDDKLTQREWSQFSQLVDKRVQSTAAAVHFAGCSMPDAPWQNACWVFEIDETAADDLQRGLAQIRANYQQDSVAWTEGQTVFV